MLNDYLKKILAARVYDVAIETPLHIAPFLTERLGNQIWLKREDQQPVYSFKLRGAYNKIVQLTEEEKAKGVITASAGNHAQGVALAAQKLNIKATIVMPRTTPDIKVRSVKARGARVIVSGYSVDEPFAHSQELVLEKGLTYVDPYDEREVIAGQGRVAMDVLCQLSGAIDAVFIPVGGGGLAAGIAAYIKALRP